jgi:hypothetical protein
VTQCNTIRESSGVVKFSRLFTEINSYIDNSSEAILRNTTLW